MVDKDGYRPNVGIIVTNPRGQLLWAKRIGQDAWQFPQGGINEDETAEDALYRELYEELGLVESQVTIIASTHGWLHYKLPPRLVRQNQEPVCIGQKQRWFLLELNAPEDQIEFDATGDPEFDGWQWVSYWFPLSEVVSFKREVYRKALKELRPRMNKYLTQQEKKTSAA